VVTYVGRYDESTRKGVVVTSGWLSYDERQERKRSAQESMKEYFGTTENDS
jgi:hypothetical protein